MPDLAPAERDAFLKRLKKLDLDETAVLADELTITANTKTVLARAAMGSRLEPRILQTRNLDDVRRWVGVPEAVASAELKRPSTRLPTLTLPGAPTRTRVSARARSAPAPAPEAIPTEFSSRELAEVVSRAGGGLQAARALKSDQLAVLRTAARAYVRGNKEAASQYKTAIEAMFTVFEIAAWIFVTVRVSKNAILEFGTGVHHLTAYRIILEPGAKIRSYGHLTVDCVKHEAPTVFLTTGVNNVIVNP